MLTINTMMADGGGAKSNGSSVSFKEKEFVNYLGLLENILENIRECKKSLNLYDDCLDRIEPNFNKRVVTGHLDTLENSKNGYIDQVKDYEQIINGLIERAKADYADIIANEENQIEEVGTSDALPGFSNDAPAYVPTNPQPESPGNYSNDPINPSNSDLPDYIDDPLMPSESDIIIDVPSNLDNTSSTGSVLTGMLASVFNDLTTDEEKYEQAIVYTNSEQGEASAIWVDLTDSDSIQNVLDAVSSSPIFWGSTVTIFATGGLTGATYIGQLTPKTDANGNVLPEYDYNHIVVQSSKPDKDDEDNKKSPVYEKTEEMFVQEAEKPVYEDIPVTPDKPVYEEVSQESVPPVYEELLDVPEEPVYEDIPKEAETPVYEEILEEPSAPSYEEASSELAGPNIEFVNVGPESVSTSRSVYSPSYVEPVNYGGSYINNPMPIYEDPIIKKPVYTFESMEPTVENPDLYNYPSSKPTSDMGIEMVNVTPLSDITPISDDLDQGINASAVSMGSVGLGTAATMYGIKRSTDNKKSEEEEDKKENKGGSYGR